MAAYMIWGNT